VLGLIQLIQPVDLDFAGGRPGEHPVRLPDPGLAAHLFDAAASEPRPRSGASNQGQHQW
jgi:hypothetical protein